MNHIPDKYEHLVRYYDYYSNRSREARKQVEQEQGATLPTSIDESPVDARRKASWARLIQKVYQVDPLECLNCGAMMRFIALIDDAGVVERILRHLKVWDPIPDLITPAGPDPVSAAAASTLLRPLRS